MTKLANIEIARALRGRFARPERASLATLGAQLYGQPLAMEQSRLLAVEAAYRRACAGRGLSEADVARAIDEALATGATGSRLKRLRERRGESARGYDPAEAVEGAVVAGTSVPIVDGVAILEVRGMIVKPDYWFNELFGWTSTHRLEREFQACLRDDRAEAILLHIDSPGGTVDGTFQLADSILAGRGAKPIGAYIDGVGASGGYAVACAADPGRVSLYRTSVTGSVGVYLIREDATRFRDQIGVAAHVIRSGLYKAATDPDRFADEDVLGHLQRHIDALADQFFETVAAARGMTPEEVANLDAATFVGAESIDARLCDSVGGFDDAIAELREAAGGAGASAVALADVRAGAETQPEPVAEATVETESLTPSDGAAEAREGDDAMPTTPSKRNATHASPTKPRAASAEDDEDDEEESASAEDDEKSMDDEEGEYEEDKSQSAAAAAVARDRRRIAAIYAAADDLGIPRSHAEVDRMVAEGVGDAAAMKTLIGLHKNRTGAGSAVEDALGGAPAPVSGALGGDGSGKGAAAGSYFEARLAFSRDFQAAHGRAPRGDEINQGLRRVHGDQQLRAWIKGAAKAPPPGFGEGAQTVA